MKKTVAYLSVFALLFSSLIPSTAFAEEIGSVHGDAEHQALTVLTDTELYSETEPSRELGEVAEGAILLAEKIENGKTYFQWNDHLAYIDEEKTEFVETEIEDDFFIEADESVGSFIVLKETEVKGPNGDIIAYLREGVEYSFQAVVQEQYEIVLGNRVGYVNETHVHDLSRADKENLSGDVDQNTGNDSQEDEEKKDGIKAEKSAQDFDQAEPEDSEASGREVSEEDGDAAGRNLFSVQSVGLETLNAETNFGKYFEVIEDNLTVYDNRTGKLIPIGTLVKGQHYPRVSDYGNWHRIQFGDRYGYVWKDGTKPSDGKVLKNLNPGLKNGRTSFEALVDLVVYDNTSGKLVPFATISKGQEHPVISDYGNWYRIDVSGRIGYVWKNSTKVPFTANTRYFEVTESNLTVYDNRTGKLIPIGTLVKGQHYPRVSDYGNWHRIQFGDRYGYVWKDGTRPSDGKRLKNLNTGHKNINIGFETLVDVTVYDNTSGKLIPFATISKGQKHPIISDYGNWLRIDVSGRIGFVWKESVKIDNIIYSNYNYTLAEMLDAQMKVNPQTDAYRNKNAFVHVDYIKVSSGSKGTVTADVLNVREEPNTNSWIYGQLRKDNIVTIVRKVGSWYEIKYGVWRNAKRADVARYVNPSNYLDPNNHNRFQFLILSGSAGTSASDLNRYLSDKGIFKGKGAAFIEASKQHDINEVYLLSHALLETGNGTSDLANGRIKVNGQRVYNMFGVGAYDGCAIKCGAEYAYNQKWFTPEAAIIGGAKFIAESYVNHPTYKQDTLYKMRWNPVAIERERRATHQYATDIGWAVKQVGRIKSIYDQLNVYTLKFDIPRFK